MRCAGSIEEGGYEGGVGGVDESFEIVFAIAEDFSGDLMTKVEKYGSEVIDSRTSCLADPPVASPPLLRGPADLCLDTESGLALARGIAVRQNLRWRVARHLQTDVAEWAEALVAEGQIAKAFVQRWH